MIKYVYLFEEGHAGMKETLGGKGANLAEMTRAGLPVPPGFTITTNACTEYYRADRRLTGEVTEQLWTALRQLEVQTGKGLGDPLNPLLVSVRSGAVHSMPGMMDTVLNLGLNDDTVQGLARLTGNPRFAYDCYRRFLQMFGDVVLGVEHYEFEQLLDDVKAGLGKPTDPELTAEDWQDVIRRYKDLILKETKHPFPQDPQEQLTQAVQAVFNSWNNNRARVYRRVHQIPDDLGTAVNIQAMVFGNMGDDSGTGVAFTRNPSTGGRELYGEYLLNAQGEDVVAGIRTPQPLTGLQSVMPAVYEEFQRISERLETHYQDMQDIEFTIERGQLYLLQTRNAKRTAQAGVKVAVDLCQEGIIDRETALLRVDPEALDQLLHRRIDPAAQLDVLATGLPASPGAATGLVVFDADMAEKMGNEGLHVILVRPETTPDDIHGIVAAQGILTSRGGMTSHAAVVARGMGKPCVCGCEELKIDLRRRQVTIFNKRTGAETILHEGDRLSLDGGTGRVIKGEVPLIDPELSPEFQQLLDWADEARNLSVRANADNPEDAAKARAFGAEGIGLCRTEHMFMAQDRVPLVRDMILAETFQERRDALEQLLPLQQGDFEGILQAMAGQPVTIRLLDPPLHEFLPNMEDLLVELTKLRVQGADPKELRKKENMLRKVRSLHEFNPMLGHRGCRLGITYPEIYVMQARAIFQAAATLQQAGVSVTPEVMIPLVCHVNELRDLRSLVEQTAEQVMQDTGTSFRFLVGTMIEVPRAALTADEIAAEADFFSFGTNDLTQTTFGFSRDDAEGKFLHQYVESKLLPDNPFAVLDRGGVGKLVQMGAELGRRAKPGLKLGICGEHGGEKRSIEFCYRIGLDYVSCSPYRVPLARLAAAQATIRNR